MGTGIWHPEVKQKEYLSDGIERGEYGIGPAESAEIRRRSARPIRHRRARFGGVPLRRATKPRRRAAKTRAPPPPRRQNARFGGVRRPKAADSAALYGIMDSQKYF